MMRWFLICITLFAAAPARSQDRDPLVELINEYRAAPANCDGRPADPAPPLAPHPALASVQVSTGTFLELALERAGYPVAQAAAISISGPPDARAAMAAIEHNYCKTLLSAEFSSVGVRRSGDSWLIVFAQAARPSPVLQLRDWQETGKAILAAVNQARATGRICGGQRFGAALALTWNDALGEAALAHSGDMARLRYFSHRGKDGRVAADRATEAGYRWRRIGENIAAGQESPAEAVAGWLSSPGHCANIMNGDFKEMGAAYAINNARQTARVYWTQVFGTPR